MSNIIPTDNHYVLSSFVVTVALQFTCFLIAYIAQFDKITVSLAA
jgi:hypothetical protein